MRNLYSRYLFPTLLDLVMDRPLFEKRRIELLSTVYGRTLEIGVGTGLNFPHYPESVSSLMAIDPNKGMSRKVKKRADFSPLDITFETLDGASLSMPDNSFDSVVSSWTLCSIENVAVALTEINRVLKPGGRFYFLEHGLSENEKTRTWQHRLTPINKVVSDGCHLNRDIAGLINESGLAIKKLEIFLLEEVPFVFSTHYRGFSEKR